MRQQKLDKFLSKNSYYENKSHINLDDTKMKNLDSI